MTQFKRFISAFLALSLVTNQVALLGYSGLAGGGGGKRLPVGLVGRGIESRELVSGWVRPETGGVLVSGSLRLSVPVGAVSRPVRIRISRLEAVSDVGDGRRNVTAGAMGYRFEPKGLRFRRPVLLRLPYEESLNRDEVALEDLRTYFYDERRGGWESLRRVGLNRGASTITSWVEHFTDMINSTLKMPEGSSPISFDMNSIKSLEAAAADAGIPKLEGFEASQEGEAAFRVPLRLLPGRGAAVPSLSLSYSSSAGNGLMGLGFNVSHSSLRLDTRFGVPGYEDPGLGDDPGPERYLLDGRELEYLGEGSDGARVYRQRRERGRLARIRWYLSRQSPGRDYWEVTDRNGTQTFYGRNEAWLGPGRAAGDGSTGKDSGVYIWQVDRVVDRNGNTIDYDWEYVPGDRNLYLKSLAYSGSSQKNAFNDGAVRVDFLYNQSGHMKKTDQSNLLGILAGTESGLKQRPDVRVDGRGGFIMKTSRRLDRIEMRGVAGMLGGGAGTLVRYYKFLYRQNEFGQTVMRRYEEHGVEAGGQESLFYGYDFEYYGLETQEEGNNTGYSGFEEEQTWSYASQNVASFAGGRFSIDTGASGSLSFGMSLFIPLIFFRLKVLSIDLNYTWGSSRYATMADLVDLNGDGLPDMAWKSGTSMKGLLNNSLGLSRGGFADSYELSGMGGHYSSGKSDIYALGGTVETSAGNFSVSGGLKIQNSWNTGTRMAMDVNGDGYLDFLQAGRAEVGLNEPVLAGGRTINWNNNVSFAAGSGSFSRAESFTTEELEKLRRNFYLEMPLRKWKGSHSGEVEITSTLKYKTGSGSDVGVAGVVVMPERDDDEVLNIDTDTGTTDVDDTATSTISSVILDTKNTGKDEIFFLLRPPAVGGNYDKAFDWRPENNVVDWNAELRYESIKLFEGFEDAPEYDLPSSVESADYSKIADLDALYDNDTTYVKRKKVLKTDWEGFVGKKELEKIIEKGYFLPRVLSYENYDRFVQFIKAGIISKERKNNSLEPLEKPFLTWRKDNPRGVYRRVMQNSGDANLGELKSWIASLGKDEMAEIINYNTLLYLSNSDNADSLELLDKSIQGGPYVRVRENADITALVSRRSAVYETSSGKVFDGSNMRIGQTSIDGAVLLDRIVSVEDGSLPELLKLEPDGTGRYRLLQGTTRIMDGIAPDASGDVEVELPADGRNKRRYILRGGKSLLETMSQDYYHKISSDWLNYLNISFDGMKKLSPEEFTALKSHQADTAFKAKLDSIYQQSHGEYNPLMFPTASYSLADQRVDLLRAWRNVPKAGGAEGLLRGVKPGLPLRAIPWTVAEKNRFVSAGYSGALLMETADYGSPPHVPQNPAGQDWENALKAYHLKQEILSACEMLPGESLYVLRALASAWQKGEIRSFMVQDGGLGDGSFYSDVSREIWYETAATLTVNEVNQNGLSRGQVELFYFKDSGETRKMELFVPAYNSREDFVAPKGEAPSGISMNEDEIKEELKRFKHESGESIDEKNEKNRQKEEFYKKLIAGLFTEDEINAWKQVSGTWSNETLGKSIRSMIGRVAKSIKTQNDDGRRPREYFGEGARGWHYGVWNDYYPFAAENIGKEPAKGEPSYFAGMVPNLREDSNGNNVRFLKKWGNAADAEVGDSAWVGSLSEVDEGEISVGAGSGDSGDWLEKKKSYYAPVIESDEMRPSRVGGPTLQNYPGMTFKGPMGHLTASKSETFAGTVSGSVGFLSGSVGVNWGESLSYEAVMDVNGDRYADMVKFPHKGGGSFKLWPGNASGGFDSEALIRTVGRGFAYLGENTLLGFSLGGSVGAPMGSTQFVVDAEGNVRSFNANSPSKPGDITATTGLAANAGTSITFSGNVQSRGVQDINGDGLPDFVSRSGVSSLKTLLNTGGKFDTPQMEWGNASGFNNTVTDDLNDIRGKTHGLSMGHSGSLGANVGLGVSAGAGSVSFSFGGSVGMSTTVGRVGSRLMDFTGDGLADLVSKKPDEDFFRVRVNLGDGFAQKDLLIFRPDWKDDLAQIGGYLNADLATLFKAMEDQDVAGSKPDITFPSGGADIMATVFSLQTDGVEGLLQYLDPRRLEDVLEYNLGLSVNLGLNLGLKVDLIVLSLRFGVGGNSTMATTSARVQMQDMNGDGLPDHVLHYPGRDDLRVKMSNMGRVGLLREVYLPTGGRMSVEYERSENTVSSPQSRWLMSAVTVWDGMRAGEGVSEGGLETVHERRSEFVYGDDFYDRVERRYWGFGDLERRVLEGGAGSAVLHTVWREYERGSNVPERYGREGLLSRTLVFEGRRGRDDEAYGDERYTYDYAGLSAVSGRGVVYPVLIRKEVRSREFELGVQRGEDLIGYTEYSYDGYGNVKKELGWTEGDRSATEVEVRVGYEKGAGFVGLWLLSLPVSLEVRDASGVLVRKRGGVYDARGNLTGLRQYRDVSGYDEYEFEWMSDGNIEVVEDPRGYRVVYGYDESGRYVKEIRTSGEGVAGYVSGQSWDGVRGLLVGQVDVNGNNGRRSYDVHGRLRKVYTPYDGLGDAAVPAVEYVYEWLGFVEGDHPGRRGSGEVFEPLVARSRNKVSFDSSDGSVIETLSYQDGLGGMLQMAKSGYVQVDGTGELGWNVSGAVVRDVRGRVLRSGGPEFVSGVGVPGLLDSLGNVTRREYDGRDRLLRLELPDGSATVYGYENAGSGLRRERVVDALGNVSERVLDGMGRVRGLKRGRWGDESAGVDKDYAAAVMEAEYGYAVTGELLRVVQKGDGGAEFETRFGYDLRGLRLSMENAQRGLVEYGYDAAGNMTSKRDANLREYRGGQSIEYAYDGLNRLLGVSYPAGSRAGDVAYAYGAAGALENGAGRIVRRRDASGVVEYGYGDLGERVRERRVLDLQRPLAEGREMEMRYGSDYLGRMVFVEYPDGERVSYGYDAGGQVNRVLGWRSGASSETVFVEDVGYDKWGRRAYVVYGNGTRTEYAYDEDRLWLKGLETRRAATGGRGERVWQDLGYEFDVMGNVTGRSDASDGALAGVGSSSRQEYKYDALYQLVGAEGDYAHNPHSGAKALWKSHYEQGYEYDGFGNMRRQKSSEVLDPVRAEPGPLNYDRVYEYGDEGRPHQASRIGGLYLSYDGNGNVVEENELVPGARLDDWGDLPRRAVHRRGDVRYVDFGFGVFEDVLEGKAKGGVGEGKGEAGTDKKEPYVRSFEWDEENRLAAVREGDMSVGYVYGGDGERSSKYVGGVESLYYNQFWSEVDYGGGDVRGSKHVYLGEERLVTRLSRGAGAPGYEDARTYWHHGDHLGSVSLVTDYRGEVYERVEYTPYGELWQEFSEDASFRGDGVIPWRFTGKERDEETGLYYYGARYYHSGNARWMSLDPAGAELMNPMGGDGKPRSGYSMVESLNWYAYVSNNPVKYVDPSGMRLDEHLTELLKRHANSGGDQSPEPTATDFIGPLGDADYTVTSEFEDPRGKEEHQGTDLAAPEGTDVLSVGDGEVVLNANDPDGYGYYTDIEHPDGSKTRYAHLKEPSPLKVGDEVKQGDVIGQVGSTGNSTGPHLHLELFKNKRKREDPRNRIPIK